MPYVHKSDESVDGGEDSNRSDPNSVQHDDDLENGVGRQSKQIHENPGDAATNRGIEFEMADHNNLACNESHSG